jgi:hypothetical protein
MESKLRVSNFKRVSVSPTERLAVTSRQIKLRTPASKDFSSSLCVQTGSEAHLASCTMGTRGPFSGGKARPGSDADNSPPYSAEVINE